MKTLSHILITPSGAFLNGDKVSTAGIIGLYREFIKDYPKFFKMDSLCELGFIAAELLMKDLSADEKDKAAIVLFNRNGSLVTDRNYQRTIEADSYFPSPALFVYTLANIVTGEIAIRHKIHGETSFYVLPNRDNDLIDEVVGDVFYTSNPTFVLGGWIEYDDENNYLADMKLVTK